MVHVALMEKMRNAYRILVRKTQGKRSLEGPRYRWDNIKINITETGWDNVHWIQMAHGRVGFCEHNKELPVSIKEGNFLNSWGTINFSSCTLRHEVSYNGLIMKNKRRKQELPREFR